MESHKGLCSRCSLDSNPSLGIQESWMWILILDNILQSTYTSSSFRMLFGLGTIYVMSYIDLYWFILISLFDSFSGTQSLQQLGELDFSAPSISGWSIKDFCFRFMSSFSQRLEVSVGLFWAGHLPNVTANLAQVLSALNLEANPGDVVALVGESGAGKSASVKLGEMTTCLSLNWNWSHAF